MILFSTLSAVSLFFILTSVGKIKAVQDYDTEIDNFLIPRPIVQNSDIDGRIFNGDFADDSYPFHVAIVYDESGFEQNVTLLCGGSLLDDSHVLTAAHCAGFIKFAINMGYLIQAWIGDRNLWGFKGLKFDISNVVVENYMEKPLVWNDVAVVTLREKIALTADSASIFPICLGNGCFTNHSVQTVGYGAYDCANSSVELRVAFGKARGIDNCGRKAKGAALVYSQVCGEFFSNNGEDTPTHSGDSGSAMFFQDHDGQFIQVGLVSFGWINTTSRCPIENHPTVFTRVAAFIPFILDHAPNAKVCQFFPPKPVPVSFDI